MTQPAATAAALEAHAAAHPPEQHREWLMELARAKGVAA